MVMASCFDFAAIFLAHRVKNFYDDEEDDKDAGEKGKIYNNKEMEEEMKTL